MVKLDPEVRAAADKIYEIDTVKFRRLVIWIKQAEKNQYSTASIVCALKDFLPYAKETKIWYPYLDKLIVKAEKNLGAAASDRIHAQLREETAKLAGDLKYATRKISRNVNR